MVFQDRDQSSFRSYQRISLEKRKRLVELVVDNGIAVSKACKKMRIKLTTARLIIKRFRETGDFPMRNFRHKTTKQATKDTPINIKIEEQIQDVEISQEDRSQEAEEKIEEIKQKIIYIPIPVPQLTYYPQIWSYPAFYWQP